MTTSELKLREFLQDIAKKENYESSKIDIKPISSGGANFTADLFLATISEPPKPDINIFAKTANLNEEARKNSTFMANMYDTEAIFYTDIVANFERIYDEHQVPAKDRLIIPKYYGHVLVPYEELLVLENLEAKGFRNFDRTKAFDWEYAAQAVTQLAKFHALGLALREDNPEELERVAKNFDFNPTKDQEMMKNVLRLALENASEALNADEKKRLFDYFSSVDSVMAMTTKMYAEDKTVLIHNDFRSSNLMHRRRNGKLEVILIDYQTLRIGNPIVDLMYFIFSGSDSEFRRFHYERLFDHYFTQLTLALKQVNLDVENVYPRKRFEAEKIELRPLGLFLGLMLVGMMTAAPEDAPKIDGNFSQLQVKPNQLALERIRGIVKDFIRWGLL